MTNLNVPLCLSVYQSAVCLSVFISDCDYVNLSVYRSSYVAVSVYLSIYRSIVYVCVILSIYWSIYVSVCLYVCLVGWHGGLLAIRHWTSVYGCKLWHFTFQLRQLVQWLGCKSQEISGELYFLPSSAVNTRWFILCELLLPCWRNAIIPHAIAKSTPKWQKSPGWYFKPVIKSFIALVDLLCLR